MIVIAVCVVAVPMMVAAVVAALVHAIHRYEVN